MGLAVVQSWSRHGSIALLGCTCGDVGCWPLESRVRADDELVTWDQFVQPHRPTRDYTAFSPFVFPRGTYDEAVRAALDHAGLRPPP